ncbi:MAG: hypothetical protein AB8B44_07670 [Prochlorococcus sp.]
MESTRFAALTRPMASQSICSLLCRFLMSLSGIHVLAEGQLSWSCLIRHRL